MAHVAIEDIERYSLFTRIDLSAQAGDNKIVLRACPWNMAGDSIDRLLAAVDYLKEDV